MPIKLLRIRMESTTVFKWSLKKKIKGMCHPFQALGDIAEELTEESNTLRKYELSANNYFLLSMTRSCLWCKGSYGELPRSLEPNQDSEMIKPREI